MTVQLCVATKKDLDKCAEIIAQSFGPVEPTLRWYFPQQPSPQNLLAIVHIWMETAYHDGTLITAKLNESAYELPRQIVGVAIWHKENSTKTLRFSELWKLWQRLWPLMGIHTWRYFYEAWAAQRARGNGKQCYLAGIAVSEHARGQGIARRLISAPPCAELPLVLECREELVPFYASHGFRVENNYRLPGVTKMYSMRKEFN